MKKRISSSLFVLFVLSLIIWIIAAGLRIYSYWVEPPERILFRHTSATLVWSLPFLGIGIFLLSKRKQGKIASSSQKWLVIGLSLFLASFLLVCISGKTLIFSPPFCFSVNIEPLNGEEMDFVITWLTTARGDISYSQLKLEGWEWVKETHVLQLRSSQNLLKWCGYPGTKILIKKTGKSEALVHFNWNGRNVVDTIPRGEYIYVSKLDRTLSLRHPAMALAWLSFWLFALGILVNIWPEHKSAQY